MRSVFSSSYSKDMLKQHDPVSTVGGLTAVSLAAAPWFANLEALLRVCSYFLSCVVAALTIWHLYSLYFRKKK